MSADDLTRLESDPRVTIASNGSWLPERIGGDE